MTYDDGTVEEWSPDGGLRVEYANGDSYVERYEGDTAYREYPDGSTYVQHGDGTSEMTNPWGEKATVVPIEDDGRDGWLTTYEDGATRIEYENGDTTYVDASGFTRQTVVDPATGDRATTASDGTYLLERTDGTFVHRHPDGTEDTGVLDAEGNVVVTRADGTTGVIRPDGSESWTDAYGVATETMVNRDGSITTMWSDGWSETISADGFTMMRNGPDGESQVTTYNLDGTVDTRNADGSSKRYDEVTGTTTFTTAVGDVMLMREDGEIQMMTDGAGAVIEYNDEANTVTLMRADGTTLTTERTADGGYRLDLGGGTVLAVDGEGNQRVLMGDGHEVSDDGGSVDLMDGGQMFITETGETVSISYEPFDECEEDCVESLEWDKEGAALTVTLGDGTESLAEVMADGSLTVSVGGQVRTYHPVEGLSGATDGGRQPDGTMHLEGDGGGEVDISHDGRTMEVTDGHGNHAKAVEVEGGVMVVVDGEEQFFPYGDADEPDDWEEEPEDELPAGCEPGAEEFEGGPDDDHEDHDGDDGPPEGCEEPGSGDGHEDDYDDEGHDGPDDDPEGHEGPDDDHEGPDDDHEGFDDDHLGEEGELGGAVAHHQGDAVLVVIGGVETLVPYTDEDWAEVGGPLPADLSVALREGDGVLIVYQRQEWFVPFD